MYKVKYTNQFKKDYKLAQKRGKKTELLEEIVEKLAKGEALPVRNRDHELTGNYKGFKECHIEPDWLLIYLVKDNVLTLTLTRTGTHSDLFK